MKLTLSHLPLGALPDLAGRLWSWWRGEIVALVPPGLRTRPRPIVTLDWMPDGVAIGIQQVGMVTMMGTDALARPERPPLLTRALATPNVPTDRVLLRLPESQILRRRINVPPAPARNLRPLIGFELERQTPFQATQVRYDFRVVARDEAARRLIVELALVKNSRVEELLAVAERWGLRPTAIGASGGAWSPNFLRTPIAVRPLLRRHRLSLGLAATILALLAGLWAGEARRHDRYEAALASALAQSRGAAEATQTLRRDLDALDTHLALLPGLKNGPDAARLLEELARRLPDGTYLSDFELNGRAIRIRGTSNAATGLIAILGASPMLTNVRFAAPVVQASGAGTERFDLAMDLGDGSGS
jgi:general secretion pathway protein L